ncbi:MAG: hypothetical protein MUF53_02930 [Gemmatimonadaceae bacterium]|jgi:spore germination protein YaaH|nr:hypothetical protein [Gemmatimonadaceae bacterium]
MPHRRVAAGRALAASLAASLGLLLTACASWPGAARRPAWWGFAAPWDPRSDASLVTHGPALDAAVTGWLVLDTLRLTPSPLFADTLAAGRPWARRRFALVTSYQGERFHPETIRRLAADASALATAAAALGHHLRAGQYRGAIFDFEALAVDDLPALRRVLQAFVPAARAAGAQRVALAIPAADSAYPARPLAEDVDDLVVMLYDQHWAGGGPGPVAAPDWVARTLEARLAEVPARRLVAALPLYGYHWPATGPAAVVGPADAERVAAAAGLPLALDARSLHRTVEFPGGGAIWVADEALLARLLDDVHRLGITRVAFWRLGLETDRFWALRRSP